MRGVVSSLELERHSALGCVPVPHRVATRLLHSSAMKLPSLIATILLAAAFVVAGLSFEAKAEPAFPGQPHMNNALKHLKAAKDKVGTDTTGALSALEEAHVALSHASKNKGTYQTIARQLTEQAEQYLKSGDTEKAAHKIDEAIETVNHGGETGAHEK
jgi:hypothetical protein